jgi:hypothetical protein
MEDDGATPPAVLAAGEPPPSPWVPTLLGKRKLAPVPASRRTRRKLWELPTRHHCILLGAAFDPRELRQLFRRGPYADWEKASDYAVICVASGCSHCTYFAVKRYCKRFGKPCVMLDNASVGALARSLGAVGAPAGGRAQT